MLKISKFVDRNVYYVEIPGYRSEVLDLMLKRNVTTVPIVRKGTRRLVGVITKRELVAQPDEEQLAMIVRRDIEIPHEEDLLDKAIEIMIKEEIEELPVCNSNNELLGVLKISDILRRVVSIMKIEDTIKGYYDNLVPCVWIETPLRVAMSVMKYLKTDTLVVLNNESQIVGLITDKDLIRQVEIIVREMKSDISAPSEGEAWSWDPITLVYVTKLEMTVPLHLKVSDIMRREVPTVSEFTSISRCARLMVQRNTDRLLVLDTRGEPAGILRGMDVLRAFHHKIIRRAY